jgi:hypothetical protein
MTSVLTGTGLNSFTIVIITTIVVTKEHEMIKRALGAFALLAIVLVAAAAAMVVRPTDAPDYRGPAPEVTTDGAVTHTISQSFDMTPERLAAWMRENELVNFLKASGSIPAIESTTPLSGDWFAAGAKRRVNLAGGHTAVERILEFGPRGFRYQVWGFTTPVRYLLDQAVGEIRYEADGLNRSRLVWTYTLVPRTFFTRPLVERFMRDEFAPFMNRGLADMAAAARAAP